MRKTFARLIVLVSVPWLLANLASAATSNWVGPGSDFNTSGNWDSGVPTDIAGFNSATPTSISFSVDNTMLNTLLFNSGAAAYTLAIPNAIFVTLAGQGIVNNSTAVQTIINNGGSAHGLAFTGSASAGNAVITNNLGNLGFQGNSTAGNATIINNEAGVVFQDNSSAGNAKIVINPDGGGVDFYDNSTAGNASITNESSLVFEDNATANNATIINVGNATTSIMNMTGSGLTVGSLAGSGFFELDSNFGSNTLTVGGNSQSTIFSGEITDIFGDGPGSFVKVGTGTLTLSGTNSYTGGTVVGGGTLNVTGSLTGNTLVQTGATLSGTGSVGSVNNSGTVTPGVSGAGTLTASTYSGSGTLNIPFNGGIHSSLAVTGNANLTRGTLSITGTTIASGRYDILTAGSLTGTFASVTTSPDFFQFQTQYTPTDVEVLINSLYYSSLAQTQNQRNVAWVLDASAAYGNSNFTTVTNALSNLSTSQAQAAINQFSGDALASFSDVGLQNAAAFTHQMLDHGSPDNSLTTAGLAMPVQLVDAGDVGNLGAVNSGKPQDPNGIWARGIGLFDKTNGDSSLGSPGSTADTGGFQVGYDYTLTDEVLLGVSGGYAKTSLTVDDRSSSGDTTADEGGVYARFTPGPWFFNASVAYSANSNDNSRTITFPGISEQANAGFNSHVITGFAEAGYTYKPEASFSLEPSVSIRESNLQQDGYTETGAPGLDLMVGDQSLNSTVSSLGMRLSHVFFDGSAHPATLGARAAWEHELGNTDNLVTAQFADAPGASFTVQGTPRPRNSAALGLDGHVDMTKNLQAFADYSATLGSDENLQEILGGLRLKW